MAPQDHPPQHQQQPYTPSSASTIYASPASEHGRLPPPPTTNATTANGALHPGGTPLSSSTIAAHSSSQSYPYNGIKTEDSVDGNSASPDEQLNASDEPPKKKQKRNKPTLSCHECVERKTKVCAHWLFASLLIQRVHDSSLPRCLASRASLLALASPTLPRTRSFMVHRGSRSRADAGPKSGPSRLSTCLLLFAGGGRRESHEPRTWHARCPNLVGSSDPRDELLTASKWGLHTDPI